MNAEPSIGHKKQHWIPRAYLKAWCDPDTPADQDPYVWRFSKDGETVHKKAPKNIFFEKDLYTIHLAGTRDLTVEHGLAGLEDSFVRIREEILNQRGPLSAEDHLLLRAFVAAMQSRSRAHLEHWQRQWRGVVELADDMRETMRSMTPEQREAVARMGSPPDDSVASIGYDELQELAEGPAGRTVVTLIQGQLPVLAQMTLTVLCSADSLGFITSDMPCVWFDPEAYKRPAMYRDPGLGSATIEVTLPISPEQMLLLTRRPLKDYLDVSSEVVDELNRRTRFQCDEYFVVSRNEKRDIWFDSGRPPEH